jgi:hypothetical protein
VRSLGGGELTFGKKFFKDVLGVYHVGLEVHSTEYCFGNYHAPNSRQIGGVTSGIFAHEPKKPGPQCVFKDAVKIGSTSKMVGQVEDLIEKLATTDFHKNQYNLIHHNCTNFARRLVALLGPNAGEVPSWVHRGADIANWTGLYGEAPSRSYASVEIAALNPDQESVLDGQSAAGASMAIDAADARFADLEGEPNGKASNGVHVPVTVVGGRQAANGYGVGHTPNSAVTHRAVQDRSVLILPRQLTQLSPAASFTPASSAGTSVAASYSVAPAQYSVAASSLAAGAHAAMGATRAPYGATTPVLEGLQTPISTGAAQTLVQQSLSSNSSAAPLSNTNRKFSISSHGPLQQRPMVRATSQEVDSRYGVYGFDLPEVRRAHSQARAQPFTQQTQQQPQQQMQQQTLSIQQPTRYSSYTSQTFMGAIISSSVAGMSTARQLQPPPRTLTRG